MKYKNFTPQNFFFIKSNHKRNYKILQWNFFSFACYEYWWELNGGKKFFLFFLGCNLIIFEVLWREKNIERYFHRDCTGQQLLSSFKNLGNFQIDFSLSFLCDFGYQFKVFSPYLYFIGKHFSLFCCSILSQLTLVFM